MAVGPQGNLYVVDVTNHTVNEIYANGTVTAIGSGINHPGYIAVDSTGNVYVTDAENNTVEEIYMNGTTVIVGTGLDGPTGIAIDPWGNVFVIDTGNAVEEICAGRMIAILDGGFSGPSSVAVDPIGDLYILDHGTIHEFAPPAGPVTAFTLRLKRGWNLVSSPLVPDPQVNTSEFGGTNVTMVARYNRSICGFDIYRVGKTPVAFPVEPGMGYFLYCNDDMSYTINGYTEAGRYTTVYQGWNMAGWTSLTGSDSKSLAGKMNNVTMMAWYNATTGSYDIYRVGKTPTPFAILPGEGYFLYTTDASEQSFVAGNAPGKELYGLDFSPYTGDQDPNRGGHASEEQVRSRMSMIAPYTTWIRTYSCTAEMENAGLMAHEMGCKEAVGAWLGRTGPLTTGKYRALSTYPGPGMPTSRSSDASAC